MPVIPALSGFASLAARNPTLDPSLVVEMVTAYMQIKSCYVSASVCLIWDWWLSLEDEVELIWKSPNTPPKFLYLFSRYFGFLVQMVLSDDMILQFYCPSRLIFAAVAYHLLNFSIEFSLMIRLYALWSRDTRVGIALLVGFLASEITNLCMLIHAFRIIIDNSVPYPETWPLKGCALTYFPPFYRLCWVPILGFETLVFVLNTARCYCYRPLAGMPTIVRIFRDGVLYYACVLLYFGFDTASGYFPNSRAMEYFDVFVPALFSFLGSHLLLSIRAHASERKRLVLLDTTMTDNMPSFVKPNCGDVEGARPAVPRISLPFDMSGTGFSLLDSNSQEDQSRQDHWTIDERPRRRSQQTLDTDGRTRSRLDENVPMRLLAPRSLTNGGVFVDETSTHIDLPACSYAEDVAASTPYGSDRRARTFDFSHFSEWIVADHE